MRFNARRKGDTALEINVTSFIDVVLLLLIFFMLATTFKKPSQMVLELPTAVGGPPTTGSQQIDISISKQGEFFVNGQGLVNNQAETVRAAIEKASAGNNKLPLIISADAAAPYQAVVTAMDSAGQAGFINITMATQKPN